MGLFDQFSQWNGMRGQQLGGPAFQQVGQRLGQYGQDFARALGGLGWPQQQQSSGVSMPAPGAPGMPYQQPGTAGTSMPVPSMPPETYQLPDGTPGTGGPDPMPPEGTTHGYPTPEAEQIYTTPGAQAQAQPQAQPQPRRNNNPWGKWGGGY